MDQPETRYAKTADGVHIAYQALGDGPVDMVFVMGWVTNVEAMWDAPGFAGFLERLASFSRLILFDKRGVGLSDRVPEDRLPDLETRMDDVRAVMDAVGSERAVVFAVSEGGPMSMLFAATYPERTIALVLYGTVADFTARSPDYKEDPAEYLTRTEQTWGSLEFARDQIAGWGAPGHESDDRLVAWLASYMRKSASPSAAVALELMNRQINASHALPSIHVPTLMIGKEGDLDFRIDQIRDTASRIAGAKLVVLPGSEHFPWIGPAESVLGEVERFVVALGEEEARARPGAGDRLVHRRRRVHREGLRARGPRLEGVDRGAPPAGARPARPVPRREKSTRRATGSSPRSTAPRGRSGARGRSSMPWPRSASASGRACTRARSRRSTGRWAGWPW